MNEEIPSRRAVLRGALTVGCSLLLPAALFGCDSKQAPSAGGSAPASPPAPVPPAPPAAPAAPVSSTPAAPVDPAAPPKVSQASVQYQPQPKGELKCSDCAHFIADSSTCKLVEGPISSEGWCAIWVKRA